jgi:hypothetical protein
MTEGLTIAQRGSQSVSPSPTGRGSDVTDLPSPAGGWLAPAHEAGPLGAEKQTNRAAALDALADRVAERVAPRVAALVIEALTGSGEVRLLDAAEVARRLGRGREWVYRHAGELGAVPLGDGERPRLGFDPARVAAYLDACRTSRRTERPAEPTAKRSAGRAGTRQRAGSTDLLPIRGEAPAR